MNTFFVPFISSLGVMLAIDIVWLGLMSKTFYAKYIGHLMAPTPSLAPAGIFYLIYTSALAVLVLMPAAAQSWTTGKVFLTGALFGLAAYGTYDLTNQATLKNWPTIVTVVDLIWGALLTGVVAVIAVAITKRFG